MEIELAIFSRKWNELFEQESNWIQENVLHKENLVSIFHIGSTSVPGIKAKPIIDILLIVEDVQVLDQEQDVFEAAGYDYLGEFGLPGRRYIRKGKAKHTHHIHAYQFDNSHEIQRHLAFRDYLRKYRETAREYEALKVELAALYPNNRKAYSNGKDAFVKEVEKRALIEHWKSEK